MKILESYTEMMKQFINEADDDGEGRINMDDPIMKKTGWSKDNPDLTVGGVLKQGEKHPEYKAAKAIVDKEKGRDSGGEDDAGKLSGKSDFSRDGGDEPNPIGDPGDVPIGQLPDPSTRQGDPEKNKAYQAKKAAAAKAKAAEKPKAEPKGGDSESEHLSKVQAIGDVEDIYRISSDFDFEQKYDSVKDQDSGYKDEYGSEMSIDDIGFKARMIDAGEDARDFLGPFQDEDELVNAFKDGLAKAIATKEESIKVINGKKYRAVKESTESEKHVLKENYDRFFGDKK